MVILGLPIVKLFSFVKSKFGQYFRPETFYFSSLFAHQDNRPSYSFLLPVPTEEIPIYPAV